MAKPEYIYDDNSTRYQLISDNNQDDINWLFLPGGPGGDSMYFHSLVNQLNLPGKIWLVDFPANCSNISEDIQPDYDFSHWKACFHAMIERFNNPVIVGHSFGAMHPLLFPELEQQLAGFVILNGAPHLWHEEQARLAAESGVPLLDEPMGEFVTNPNQETFKTALLACAQYYFPPATLERGKEMLTELPFNYHAAVWGQIYFQEINFSARWIPQNVPTLIISASHDLILPYTLFENDVRFQRDNIQYKKIENAGHFPWIEQPVIVKELFEQFKIN